MEALTLAVFSVTALIALAAVYQRLKVGASLASSVVILGTIVGSLTMALFQQVGYPGSAFIAIVATYAVVSFAGLYYVVTDEFLDLPLPRPRAQRLREAKRRTILARVNDLPPAVAARALNIVVDSELRRLLEERLARYQSRQHIRAVA